MKTIGIDCRLAGHRHAGIGRYIAELVQRLPLTNGDKWVIFYSSEDQLAELFPQGVPANVKTVFTPVRHYSWAEQRLMPQYFAAEALDLLHVPHFNVPWNYQGAYVVTIHDLLWHERKGLAVTTLNPLMYLIKYGAYRLVARRSIMRAKAIITPSQTVAETVKRIYPKLATPITVTPEGVSERWLELGKQHLAKKPAHTQTTRPTFLYVGSLYPHKNVDRILEALQLTPGLRLVVATARSVFSEQFLKKVKKLELTARVELKHGLNDTRLRELYSDSTGLIQPSFSEGFGLTGLEAMALGTPVIASDIPIFREVYGEHAEYFDPHSAEKLAQAMLRVEQLPLETSYSQRKLAHRHAASYSWQRMADSTNQLYRKVLGDN